MARTRQKQELQTTDDSSTNARLVCGTKPVQKLRTLENERYAVRVLGKFHRNSGNRLKRFKVAANRQFLEFSVFDDFYVEYF